MKKAFNETGNELISVILPIYNVEKYLNKSVDSVLNQTYRNLEVILVDDGSPDNSGEICDEYAKKDERVKVIHKQNGGLSDARNAGIKIATGEYITLVDSDDYIEKDYVEFLYNLILENNAQMSICSHSAIYENGTILKKETHERAILTPEETLKRILYDDGIDISAWAKMYKKELFDEIQYPKGRLFEDAATTYKLVDECKIIVLGSESKYNYIIRNNSITTATFSSNKMQLITSTEEMCNYVKSKYPQLEMAANRRLMYAYLSTISQLAKCKEKHKEEQEKLMKYIKQHKWEILKDKKVPKRDKLGILSLTFGFNFYKKIWRMYEKITGRV